MLFLSFVWGAKNRVNFPPPLQITPCKSLVYRVFHFYRVQIGCKLQQKAYFCTLETPKIIKISNHTSMLRLLTEFRGQPVASTLKMVQVFHNTHTKQKKIIIVIMAFKLLQYPCKISATPIWHF